MSEEYERDVYVRIIGNMTKQLYNDLFSIKEEIDIIKMPKYCQMHSVCAKIQLVFVIRNIPKVRKNHGRKK